MISYIDIIDDFSAFENLYINYLIERVFNSNIFNKDQECCIINIIVENTKNIFLHSYKLQTVISTLKIVNTTKISLIGFPVHCFVPLNLGCKPNLHIKLKSLIQNELKTLPINAKLICHMGEIIFVFNKVTIKCNPLQLSILLYLGLKSVPEEEIIRNMEITENLFDFLINSLIKFSLVNKNNNYLVLNKEFHSNSMLLDIQCNLNEFISSNHEKIKETDDYINKLIDAFVMRFMKKQKESDRPEMIKNEIKIYLI